MITSKEISLAINEAVIVREKGDYATSITLLADLKKQVKQIGDLGLNEIIAQNIVSLKHKYEHTKDLNALKEIKSEIDAGLNLLIPQSSKAVFHLRLGDYYTYQGENPSALISYQKAYDLIVTANAEFHTIGEYLGHLAEAQSINGFGKKALVNFYQALKCVKQDTKIEDWYRLVILSGIRGRMIIPAIKVLKIHVAIWSFFVSYRMALKLKRVYNIPIRLDQYNRRIKKIFKIEK